MTTNDLNNLLANICQDLCLVNPDLSVLAGRVLIYNLHKHKQHFVKIIEKLYQNGYIEEKYSCIVNNNQEFFFQRMDYQRDYDIDFFAYKTFEKQYLLKVDGELLESPQDTFMRTALQLFDYDIEQAAKVYDDLSRKFYVHSSPTLMNSLLKNRNQLSSCFLQDIESDSIDGIYNSLKESALISKYGAGISLKISKIRSKGEKIGFRKNASSSIVQMLKNFDATIKYVNQQNIRNGSLAVYIDVHHPDILDFLQMRANMGIQDSKCLNLYSAVWLSDLFVNRVLNDQPFSLFDPHEVNYVLDDLYGEEYEQKYLELETKKKYKI